MNDTPQPQSQPTNEQVAQLKTWVNVGAPGPAPTSAYTPSDAEKRLFHPIESPVIIPASWTFDKNAYEKLRLGHISRDMDDKWNIYTENNTVHLHRSWTGDEIYRFELKETLDQNQQPTGVYPVVSFETRPLPPQASALTEQQIRDELTQILVHVLALKSSS